MDAETIGTHRLTRTSLTWLELARQIAAMTPEQKRRPVYFCDSDTGRIYTPGLVLAEDDLPDESDPLLHRDVSVLPGGSFYLMQNATTQDAPAPPADGLVMVALDLHEGRGAARRLRDGDRRLLPTQRGGGRGREPPHGLVLPAGAARAGLIGGWRTGCGPETGDE